MMTCEPFDSPVDDVCPAQSILPHIGFYEAKIEESEKAGWKSPRVKPRTPLALAGGSCQRCPGFYSYQPFHFPLFSSHEVYPFSYLAPPTMCIIWI